MGRILCLSPPYFLSLHPDEILGAALADEAGGGSYQTLINDALVAYLHQHSVLEAVRQVVREEMGAAKVTTTRRRPKSWRAAPQASP